MLHYIKSQSTELCGGVLGGGRHAANDNSHLLNELLCAPRYLFTYVRNSRVGQRLCSNVMDDQLLVVGCYKRVNNILNPLSLYLFTDILLS